MQCLVMMSKHNCLGRHNMFKVRHLWTWVGWVQHGQIVLLWFVQSLDPSARLKQQVQQWITSCFNVHCADKCKGEGWCVVPGSRHGSWSQQWGGEWECLDVCHMVMAALWHSAVWSISWVYSHWGETQESRQRAGRLTGREGSSTHEISGRNT